MKLNQEENTDNDDDNEKLTPTKFESFNISLPENEIQIPRKQNYWIIYLLIAAIIILIIIIIIMKRNKNEIVCPKGYFLPEDSNGINECLKCSVDNCDECNGKILSNICISCKPYLTPIFENNEIKYCKYTCETGINDKCKVCDEIKNQ